MSGFKKFMQTRTSANRKAVSELTKSKESTAPARDSLIISTPLTNKEGNMVVRFLPNKPVGSKPMDDVDAYGEFGTAWFEKRYQHNFEMNGLRVIYDCPTSLDREDIKSVDARIKTEIQESDETDTVLAEKYGMTPYLVNRVRYDNQCPVCLQNRKWWKEGQEDIVKGFGGTKRNAHYFAWVLVKEVNGNEKHEWCDGKPRILHFKKQVFDILDKELNGAKKKEGVTSNRRSKPDPTTLFYEMVDPVDDKGNAMTCEGRDFLISAVVEKKWTTYKSEDDPSEFVGDFYPVATSDEEYEAIIKVIKPLQDYILNDHKFNTYEEIEARLNKAVKGESSDDRADTNLDSEEDDSSVRDAVKSQLEEDSNTDEQDDQEETNEEKPRKGSRKDVFDKMDI